MQLFNHFPMARVMSMVKDVRWAGANTTDSVSALCVSAAWSRRRSVWSARFLINSTTGCGRNFPTLASSDLGGKLRMMRTMKSAEEIDRIRFASKLTDQSIQAVARRIDRRHARRRDSSHHRAGLSQARRLCRNSLHEQHADAQSGFSGAVAVSFQPKAAKRRLSDYRDQRRLFRLQRANSPDFFHRRRADGGVAEDA